MTLLRKGFRVLAPLSTFASKCLNDLQLGQLKHNGQLFFIQCALTHNDNNQLPGQPISRFPIPPATSLPQDIMNTFAQVEEKMGFVPNVMKALSYRPDEFRAFFLYHDALMAKKTGNLTKAERELVVVATSGLNHCLYCVVAHGAIHRIVSKNPYTADQVAINAEAADISAREKAIVDFAMKIADMDEVTEDDFQDLFDHGLNADDAWDIGAIAALFALSNRMALLTKLRPNTEFYSMGRSNEKKN